MVVGIIATLWIFYVDPLSNCVECFPSEIKIAIYLIGCFIIGTFFSQVTDWIASKNIPVINLIFYKNKLSWIKKIAKANHVNLDKQSTLEAYYDKFYSVQHAGLLGNVPPQEAISAFMLNLSALCLCYITAGILFFCLNRCCPSIDISIIIISLLPMTVISRRRVEKTIYYSIIRASKNC